jgi:hypothetical protein
MTLLAELAVVLIAVTLTTDGLRKLLDVAGFARWLQTGGLTWLARREFVYALGALEAAVGVASLHPAGRLVAIGVICAVTPVGVILVKRTGTCACRGVIRSTSPNQLIARNLGTAAVAAITLLVLNTPVAASSIFAVAVAWITGLILHHLLVTRVPLQEVRR